MSPQKFRNSAGKPYEIAELVAARCSTCLVTGCRRSQQNRWIGNVFFFSVFLRRR